ncbi:hypothetical protein HIM_06173 [Hirsutella minnesotensis 3608]|uniref:Aminoglycoside phosphotransferase domain-containing protein n=1 Tax=Hirsutella minnesotensis 3608 TaxID=1043627 RepID=A0A0F7ZU73_9HYPO|nr:hypothetical protein HIM_06173 [Hirsutella minnesotensis 3608]
MADEPIQSWKTHEREYRIYPDRFYKRSLRSSEYQLDFRGNLYVPPLGYERLQNEAACLQFISKNTDIPVPEVLEAFDDNGSFVLITKWLPGVPMKQLSSDAHVVIMKEVERHLETLRALGSNHTGGPSGILCPPLRATQYFPRDNVWSAAQVPGFDLVFCHCDLSQSNIIVDPVTLKIEGIIDWEYGGYWPEFFESPYFRDPRPSGAQFRDPTENARLVDFLRTQSCKIDASAQNNCS